MSITDKKLKSLIAGALKNKEQILALANYFDYRDIENGILNIPDTLINNEVKEKAFKNPKVDEYLHDYYISFQNGCIMLDLRINGKKLGDISAKYLISITDFRFSSDECRIYGSFQEDIKSLGNSMQGLALKAALSGSTGLQRVLKLINCNFAFADGNRLMIDLSNVEKVRSIANVLELNFLDSTHGNLKFKFNYLGGK